MRLVDRTGPGQLGLNYMWLPTFIGMNASLVAEIDAAVGEACMGLALDEKTLDIAESAAHQFLQQRFPNVPGLFDYLDGLKFVAVNELPKVLQKG